MERFFGCAGIAVGVLLVMTSGLCALGTVPGLLNASSEAWSWFQASAIFFIIGTVLILVSRGSAYVNPRLLRPDEPDKGPDDTAER